MAKLYTRVIKQYFTRYSTTPTVTVYNPAVAALYITLVTTAFCMYFASIDFNLRKLYQRECPVQGITISKVQGTASTENISDEAGLPANYRKKWDAEQLAFPAYGGEGETGSFMVITNLRITENQTRGRCTGSKFLCEQDKDCKEGKLDWSGFLTGKCDQSAGYCETEDWCPKESNSSWSWETPILEDVKNFVVTLRSIVEFPKCGEQQGHNTGLFDLWDDCMYDPVEHPRCPVFRIGDLFNQTNVDFNLAAVWGTVFRIRIKWDCDFDFGWTTSDCKPKYAFSTVQNEFKGRTTGWFFNSPQYHSNGTRTQKIFYGLKFLVNVEGKGRKFNFFTFIINLVASTGLLFVAPFVCDLILSVYEKFGSSGTRNEADKSEELTVNTVHLVNASSQSTVVPIDQKQF